MNRDRSNVAMLSPNASRTLRRFESKSKRTSDESRRLNVTIVNSKSKWILKSSWNFQRYLVSPNEPRTRSISRSLKRYYSKSKWMLDAFWTLKRYFCKSKRILDAQTLLRIVRPNEYWTHLGRSSVTIVSPNACWTLKRYYSKSKWTLKSSRIFKRYYSKSKWTLDAEWIASVETVL